ncbi:hypothetical protein [Chitinophaga silvisoli]|jgi:hypothetical protein|uniref:Outer membrane protein beta-barrel domain-containing protein n=1 Tax=Chitinophaga silvisoli TaxID=2291814 RepID=A0A3E1P7J0_9BACT|nr:hypothetical protein [Chitinophaga silvisoli]RFM36146.1 hypothetical protein DXN04_01125 [Chitinophaga silvisoli]
MKQITTIFKTFSLSFLLAGVMALAALSAQASDNLTNDNNKDKGKKAEEKLSLSAMPKANLSLDAGYRFNAINAGFKLSDDNSSWNFKSTMTIKQGNVTYVLPYAAQIQQPSNMGFHHLQIILPLRKN